MPNSSHCPHLHSVLDKSQNSQKSQEIIANLKKMWKAVTQYLWCLQQSCKNHTFTSLIVLKLISSSLFPSQAVFLPHLILVRFLIFRCLANAYQQCACNVCFVQCKCSSMKCRLNSSWKWVLWVSHSESAFIRFSPLRAQKKQRQARGLSWALHYFPTQISSYYSRSLPKLFFLLLGAKSRMTIIYHRINSL